MYIYKLAKNNFIFFIIKLFFILFLLFNFNIKACEFFNDFKKIEKEILNNKNILYINLLNKLKEKKDTCKLIKLLIKLTESYFITKNYIHSNNISNEIIKINNKEFNNYALYIKSLSNIKLYKKRYKKYFYLDKSNKDILNINIALKCLKKIIGNNNDYNYYKLSLNLFNKLKIKLLIYELNIIKFYFKKSLYLSVINRSIYIINNFPEFAIFVKPYLYEINKKINIPNYKFNI